MKCNFNQVWLWEKMFNVLITVINKRLSVLNPLNRCFCVCACDMVLAWSGFSGCGIIHPSLFSAYKMLTRRMYSTSLMHSLPSDRSIYAFIKVMPVLLNKNYCMSLAVAFRTAAAGFIVLHYTISAAYLVDWRFYHFALSVAKGFLFF